MYIPASIQLHSLTVYMQLNYLLIYLPANTL